MQTGKKNRSTALSPDDKVTHSRNVGLALVDVEAF